MTNSNPPKRWLHKVLASGALIGLMGVNLLAAGSANVARLQLPVGQVPGRALSLPSLAEGLLNPFGPAPAPYAPTKDAQVSYPVAHGTLASLKDAQPKPYNTRFNKAENDADMLPKVLVGSQKVGPDGALQEVYNTVDALGAPIANFDGQATADNGNTIHPPDTNGDIGYDSATGRKYYFQWVNIRYKAWDVTNPAAPVVVIPSTAGNTLWANGLPGSQCAADNDGDPIVLFDEQAGRWMISQFALNNVAGPFHQCIAVSQTADPTGGWNLYDFLYSSTLLNDYPHFGVWPDSTYNSYFMTVHDFDGATFAWRGQAVVAFERSKMLTGAANPAMVRFSLFSVNQNFGGMLPADLDGNAPAAGTPGFFFEVDDDTSGLGPDAMRVWEFKPNWTTPANSTFGVGLQPNYTVTVASFNLLPCTTGGSRSCIPQPGTSVGLDSIGDRLMYRVGFRQVGGTQSAVLNHTVWADGSNRAGVRWYEARRDAGTGAWSINQQGTYAPADGIYRWMASIAMDRVGNIGLGFSAASGTVTPSVRYVGREVGDPLGTLPQTERIMTAGIGSQTSSANRWGDYSMLGIDPQDQCTFWYTQEYHGPTTGVDWRTRIGSFKFDTCNAGPVGYITGTVTNAVTTAPIAGATVQAQSSPTQTFGAITNGSGVYTITAPAGIYTMTASATYYAPATANNVSVVISTTTLRNFALQPQPAIIYSNNLVTGGDGDNYLEPNETANLNIGLGNMGLANATSVNATLSSGVVNATILSANSAYPDIAPSAVQTNTTPYQVHLDAGYQCGTPLSLNLNVTSAQGAYTFTVPVSTGPATSGTVYPSTNVPMAIPDNPTVTSTLGISATGTIVDLNVTLSLNHTWDEDLDIYLVSPTGTRVELTTDNGGSSDNYINTVFDDEAATAITAGAAPFTGSYRPEGSLATLDGQSITGVWKLEIDDDVDQDTGTLNAWSLSIDTGQVGCDVPAPRLNRTGQSYNDALGNNDGYIFPGENNIRANVTITNAGSSTATNVTTTITANTVGVTVITPTASYGNLASGAGATNATPFGFNVGSNVACGANLNFTATAYSAEGVFNLGNFAFPVGRQLAYTFTNSTPVEILDVATVTSILSVAAAPRSIADVDVLINLDHTWDSDLDIFLVSPTGTRIELSTDNGSDGDNFINTILDDEATGSITLGTAPFTGSYKPETPLSAVDGQNFAGDWTLEITDDAGGDVGILNNWELRFAVAKCQDVAFADTNKWVSAVTIKPTELLTYTLTAQNTGDLALNNVVITDALPAHTTFVSASNGGALNGSNIVWNVGSVALGAPLTRTLVVQVMASAMAGDVIQNSFVLGSNEFVAPPSNMVATTVVATPTIALPPNPITLTLAPNSVITQAFNIANTELGSTLVWTVTEGAHTLLNLPPKAITPRPTGQADPASAQEVAASADPTAARLALDPAYRPATAPLANLLYDNGPVSNSPGTGSGGADESVLQDGTLGMGIFGFGHQLANNNSVADDFTVTDPSGWAIEGFAFYAYQTGSGTTSPIVDVRYQIWDGPPNAGGAVIYGDLSTNQLTATNFDNIYRVTEGTSGNTDRALMLNMVDANVVLPPGTYWIEWTTGGSGSFTGPWAPPVTINGQSTTGNALQNLAGSWGDAVDVGQQDFPFMVMGSINEPRCVPTTDTPWLSTAPNNGSLLGNQSQDVILTFNTAGLALNTTYTSTLCVASNDPTRGLTAVPVTITLAGTYGVSALPAATALEGRPGSVVTYSVWVTNTGSFTDTFDIGVSNTPAFTATVSTPIGPLGPGQSAQTWVSVQIPANALGGASSTANLFVSSQGGSASANFSLTTTAARRIYLPIIRK